jgi:hypothetical protein
VPKSQQAQLHRLIGFVLNKSAPLDAQVAGWQAHGSKHMEAVHAGNKCLPHGIGVIGPRVISLNVPRVAQ